MNKIVLVLADALGYDVARDNMGFLTDGSHGDRTPEQRGVPLFVVQPDGQGKGDTGETVSQLQLAPTILNLLDLPIPGTMKHPPLV
jgi:arylsulfatase A-like enzyme